MKVLRELAIEVVAGDVINGEIIDYVQAIWHNLYGYQGDLVSMFILRDNDGEQPVRDDVVVEVDFGTDPLCIGTAGEYGWNHGDCIVEWRPCIKSLAEVETTPKPKPVHVNPALEIGGDYEVSWTSDIWHTCIIVDIGQVGYMIKNRIYSTPKFHKKEGLQFRTIKSDRDIAIDEMGKVDVDITRDTMGKLYDLGFRKA